jgi:hypothetical protein
LPSLSSYRHVRGVHCASAALRNVCHHYTGQSWTEALCFGLGAGLNFTYVREPGCPFFLIMGRGSYIESHFCDAVGIHLDAVHSEDSEVAWDHLRRLIDDDVLPMIDADMFHLPYMVQSLDLMGGVHFGGHKVLVTGYDLETATASLSDYAWQEPRTVSLANLESARDSRDCPARPRNGCFRFHFPERLPPMADAILVSLRTLVNQMQYPFKPFNGLPAVTRFCRQVGSWGRIFEGEELALNTSLAAFMLEKAGTGGGCFRNLYSRFLRQAGEVLEAPELLRAAETYRLLAVAWREVAALLGAAAEDPRRGMYAPGGAPQRLLARVADLERSGIEAIETFLRGRSQAGFQEVLQ